MEIGKWQIGLSGIAIGLAAALSLTGYLSSMLYGVSASDPFTFGGVSLLLFSITLVAGYIPARRAAKMDPIQALHHE